MIIILAIAQEAGAANALIPVIRELRNRSGVRVVSWVDGPARKIFERQEEFYQPAFLSAQPPPDLLFIGTGLGKSLDKTALQTDWARKIPSFALVDNWCNYRERFSDPSSGKWLLPTRIGVMNDAAWKEALAAGLPQERLRVVGHPHLEKFRETIRSRWAREEGQRYRRQWLGPCSEDRQTRLILFASEQISGDFGYTEQEAWEKVQEAVQECERLENLPLRLVRKPHPSEGGTEGNLPSGPCILAADLVVGMTSLFLLEAFLAGRPCISFQPGSRGNSRFIGERHGLIPGCFSVPELVSLLRNWAQGKTIGPGVEQRPDKADWLTGENSTIRTAESLLEMIPCEKTKRIEVAG